jgi:predicted phosphodiesterase
MKRHLLPGILMGLSLWAFAAASAATPRWLRLSWSVPDATDTTMTVAWNDDDASGGTVEYRPRGSTTSSTAAASALVTGSGLLGTTYEATLNGLSPSSSYEYRVQSGGGWSDWKVFTTAPPLGRCDPFRIVIGGDGRGGEAFWDPGFVSRHWDNIAGYIKSEMPIMMVETGDIVYNGSEDQQWEEWFGISEFFTSEVPFMAVFGNHDDGPGDGDSQWYNKMYALPRSGAGLFDAAVDPEGDGIEDYWALVIGNVLFVVLTTEGVGPDIQLAFLEAVTVEWDWRVDWKIVMFHRPLWSSGAHGSNDGDTLDAGRLIALIDDYRFDFVLTGHDHDYERFHPSTGGYGGRPRVVTPLPDDGGNSGVAGGPIHVVSGGAGSFTNPLVGCREEGCFIANGHLNYMVFDFLGDRVDVTVRDLGTILTLADATMQPNPMDVFHVFKTGSVCDITPDEGPEEVDAVEVPDTVVDDTVVDDAADGTVDPPTDVPGDTAIDGGAEDAPQEAAEEPSAKGGGRGCGCSLAG